jgi:hypothetical protein
MKHQTVKNYCDDRQSRYYRRQAAYNHHDSDFQRAFIVLEDPLRRGRNVLDEIPSTWAMVLPNDAPWMVG